MKRLILPLLALGLLLGPAPVRALTAAEAQTGRAIVRGHADAVVSIQLVVTLNISLGDRTAPPREIRTEVNGTVVSPAGLTVTSLSAIDPSAQVDNIRALAGSLAARLQITNTQFKEVKLRLTDGTEVPARVVMKDADTDLVFVAPEIGAATGRVFAYVDLKHASAGEVLATYFEVSRASRELQRTPTVNAVVVEGIVERPRRLFLINSQAIGCPSFDAQGAVLGICVRHIASGRAAGFVVLPAAQVADVAQQAAVEAAKPPPAPVPAADDAASDDAGPAAPAVAPAKPAAQ